jgi:hypothetical protein
LGACCIVTYLVLEKKAKQNKRVISDPDGDAFYGVIIIPGMAHSFLNKPLNLVKRPGVKNGE